MRINPGSSVFRPVMIAEFGALNISTRNWTLPEPPRRMLRATARSSTFERSAVPADHRDNRRVVDAGKRRAQIFRLKAEATRSLKVSGFKTPVKILNADF